MNKSIRTCINKRTSAHIPSATAGSAAPAQLVSASSWSQGQFYRPLLSAAQHYEPPSRLRLAPPWGEQPTAG